MEEAISLILHGCNLARELESNLPNLANQPEALLRLCDEMSGVFTTARERLSNVHRQNPTLFRSMISSQLQELQQQRQSFDPSIQEWLKTSTSALGMFHQAQLFAGIGAIHRSTGCTELGEREDNQLMDASESGRSSSSSQRQRRKKDDAGRRTERVPAPQVGNTEIPPEDGFTWRKYGQKEILGSRYPRSYFRCTHQKLYNCPAKKQVQRLDDDPYTYEVTYRGEHTCHMSATAPSAPPLPQFTPAQMTQTVAAPHQPLPRLLESSTGAGGSGSGGGGAGPSSVVRYGKEPDCPISDMVDVMFNSGSSSTNGMELIFNSLEDKTN